MAITFSGEFIAPVGQPSYIGLPAQEPSNPPPVDIPDIQPPDITIPGYDFVVQPPAMTVTPGPVVVEFNGTFEPVEEVYLHPTPETVTPPQMTVTIPPSVVRPPVIPAHTYQPPAVPGRGPAIITGNRVLGSQTIGDAITAQSGARYRDFTAKNVGILAKTTVPISDVIISTLNVDNVHRLVEAGIGTSGGSIDGLLVQHVVATYLARGLVRIGKGSNIVVDGCVVDFGIWSDGTVYGDPTKGWIPSPSYVGKVDQIMIGVHLGEAGVVSGAVIKNSIFRNAWSPYVSGQYRQGDGAAFEGTCEDALVEGNLFAFNTDSGTDLKGPRHRVIRNTYLNNKRNMRCWGTDNVYEDNVSQSPTGAHISLHGYATVVHRNVTFISSNPDVPLVLIDATADMNCVIESYRVIYVDANGNQVPQLAKPQVREKRATSGGLTWGVNLDTGVSGPPPGTIKL